MAPADIPTPAQHWTQDVPVLPKLGGERSLRAGKTSVHMKLNADAAKFLHAQHQLAYLSVLQFKIGETPAGIQ